MKLMKLMSSGNPWDIGCQFKIAQSGFAQRNSDAFNLWCHGLRYLEAQMAPILIMVYGPEVVIPDLHTPVKFIKDYISMHFRNGYKQE